MYLYYILSKSIYVGATADQSKVNFILWLDTIVLGVSSRVQKAQDMGTTIEACYEGMSCSDNQKVLSVLGSFYSWRQACETNGVVAGKMFVVTGNENKMTVTQHHLGPFI